MNEKLRSEIVLNQMQKFSQGIEGNGQFSKYGLNTLNESREIIDDEVSAYNIIRNKYWIDILEACDQHTASLLLQLWISSRTDMFQILTFLFISEIGIQGKARQDIWEQNPIFDNVSFELTQWLQLSLDDELAAKIARVTLDYYWNCQRMNPDNDLSQLMQWIVFGNNLTPINPVNALTDEQVDIYNTLVNNAVGKRIGDMDDRFKLRTNLEFNAWFEENFKIDADPAANGIPDWLKILACGIGAVALIKYVRS
jgi:hypothetical protein